MKGGGGRGVCHYCAPPLDISFLIYLLWAQIESSRPYTSGPTGLGFRQSLLQAHLGGFPGVQPEAAAG